LIRAINNAPKKAPQIFPYPPNKLAPPKITAVITLSSRPRPEVDKAAPNLDESKIPAIPARPAEITKAHIFIFCVGIPESLAAFSLPPIK
jgi:hypothetical protein